MLAFIRSTEYRYGELWLEKATAVAVAPIPACRSKLFWEIDVLVFLGQRAELLYWAILRKQIYQNLLRGECIYQVIRPKLTS